MFEHKENIKKKRAWGAKKKLKLLNSDISASERELLGEITHNEHTDSWIFFFCPNMLSIFEQPACP